MLLLGVLVSNGRSLGVHRLNGNSISVERSVSDDSLSELDSDEELLEVEVDFELELEAEIGSSFDPGDFVGFLG